MKNLLSKALFLILFLFIFSTQTLAECGRVNRGGPNPGSCTVSGGIVCTDAPDTCCTSPLTECYIYVGSDRDKFSENVDFFNMEGISLTNPNLWTLNGMISTFLPYILSFAGVILLFMLISGGFTMLTAVSDPKAADAGKQRISAALLGFILLFISYWIIQILEIVLGITILG